MTITDHVMHATCALADTYKGLSKLPDAVLGLRGYSMPGIRRLLNNLCAFEDCRFLEVGALYGATAIAASYGNNGQFTTIDDFRGPGTRHECEKNLAAYANDAPVKLIVADAWNVPLEFVKPVDVFFYDGAHEMRTTRQAIEHFAPALADTCIVVIDDWNWSAVRTGLRAAHPDRPWFPLAQWELFTANIPNSMGFKLACHDPVWWNGLFVGVYSSRYCGSVRKMF